MIITISGQAGSGKSSVSKGLAKKLGFRYYSIGDLRREMAKQRGLTLAELNKLGETHDFTDKDVDEFQAKLGKEQNNFVIDGRLSFYFIPQSIKIYLDADLETRAKRVLKDERKVEHFKNLQDAIKGLKEREKSDKKRYKKYYNINCLDKKQYDYIIDTSNLTIKQVIDKIMEIIKGKN
jgi:cytidylate kinase